MRGRGKAFVGLPKHMTVAWMPRRRPKRILVARLFGGVLVYMDLRVARSAAQGDVVIWAWHVGRAGILAC